MKPHVAIVGAGMAGAACAHRLLQAGWTVSVFEKSRGAGGRMATRRARWVDDQGREATGSFDHGAPGFRADDPRFLQAVQKAEANGQVVRWEGEDAWLSAPEQPSWAKQALKGATLHTQHTVTALQRDGTQWRLRVAESPPVALGPFDAVVLAIPSIQAAPLVEPFHPKWAQQARAVPQQPTWTLMAASAPHDADTVTSMGSGAAHPVVEPSPVVLRPHAGPLALVVRQDLKRAPESGPSGAAGQPAWVAHATLEWTLAHLEDPADTVKEELMRALEACWNTSARDPANPHRRLTWAHATVHRWRYAHVGASSDANDSGEDWASRPCLWDAALALGLAGDAFAGVRVPETGVQRAWISGSELAERMLLG